MSSFQKKAILLSILIASLVTLWRKDEQEYIKTTNKASWIHYKKDEKGKLIQSFIKPDEIEEETGLTKPNSKNERSIASSNPKNEQKIVFINSNDPNLKPELNELTFINTYNPEWKQMLAKELMLFQPESVEVYFKPQKSVVKILDENKAMFLEEVSVTFKTNLGPHSFKALINSENGKVVETWGKTKYENFSPRSPASKNNELTPNGTL